MTCKPSSIASERVLEFSGQSFAQEEVHADDGDDGFRRNMALRKSRSKKFLEDPATGFTLLFCLVLHSLLERPVQVCFRLYDADKRGLRIPTVTNSKANQWRRHRGKQTETLPPPDVELEKQYTLADLKRVSLTVTDYLWATFLRPLPASRFFVPTVFWPEGRDQGEMFKVMTADMLKAAAGIKFRICLRYASPPYVLLDLIGDISEDTRDMLTQKFLELRACCLDPFWGKPVQDHVRTVLEDRGERAAAKILTDFVKKVATESRGVSLREENLHAIQKKFAGGWHAKARPFPQQCAQSVLAVAARNYAACKLYHKKEHVNVQWSHCKKTIRQGKIRHLRPRQFGSAVFSYVSAQMHRGRQQTVAQFRAEFKALSAADRALWVQRHKSQVALRRRAEHQRRQAADAESQQRSEKLPWDLGDEQWPLSSEQLQNFLLPFRTASTGMDALRAAASGQPDIQQYRGKVEGGDIRYHSMDAATLCAKAELGEPIEAKNQVGSNTWAEVSRCQVPGKSCLELHPGLCATVDSELLEAARFLASRLPRDDGLLRFQRAGVVYFFRLVIGGEPRTHSVWRGLLVRLLDSLDFFGPSPLRVSGFRNSP